MLKLNFSNSKEVILNEISAYEQSEWVDDIVLFLVEWWNDNDFIIAQSSGSTGEAKTIKLRKDQVINSAKMTGNFFSFDENTTSLLCMSPRFIAGKLMLVRSIVWKMNLICVEPNSSPLESLPKDILLDFAAMVPLQLQNSLPLLASMTVRKLIVGGGAVDESLLEKVKPLKTEVYSSYGMTETITHIALKKLNGKVSWDSFKVLDGISLTTDYRECLVVSAKSIADNDVVTNDIVELISDKEFKWIGRFDNVINSGGVKIHPEKIEQLLSNFIFSPFFISSIKDQNLGEKVILVVEGRSQRIDLDYVKTLLPKYHSPKDVFYLSEFIRTDSGKINRSKTLENIKTL